MSEEKVICSFCLKSQDEVQRIIAGPAHAAICDECVQLCACILLGETDDAGNGKIGPFWVSRTAPVDSKSIIKAIVEELREEERDRGSQPLAAETEHTGSVHESHGSAEQKSP